MFLRAAPFFAMLITLLLLAACETTPPSTPAPEYLAEEIPPCTPVAGSLVDPCEPDLLWSDGDGFYSIPAEPQGMRSFIGNGSSGWSFATHLVVRGTFLPGAVRCTSEGDLFRPPSYLDVSWFLQSNTKSIKCYADVRVNAYVLGSGPYTMTVMVYYSYYGFETEKEYVEELRVDLERLLLDGDELLRLNVPEGGIEGREVVLCVGPRVDTPPPRHGRSSLRGTCSGGRTARL